MKHAPVLANTTECRRCGAIFDGENTGWKTNTYRGKTGRRRYKVRYCKKCSSNRSQPVYVPHLMGELGREPAPESKAQPVEQFFVHTPVEIPDHSACRPWDGRACVECDVLWSLAVVTTAEWAVAS